MRFILHRIGVKAFAFEFVFFLVPGNSPEAERFGESAISTDPPRASHYELLLGDHFLRAKNFAVALQSFGQAAGAAPEADTPRRRIVEVYRQAEAGVNLAALLSLAE